MMIHLNINDILMITQETVLLYKGTRWSNNFSPEHIGETVRYGGKGDYVEFGSNHVLAFQSMRGTWHTPNCPINVIKTMRQSYLDAFKEDENA